MGKHNKRQSKSTLSTGNGQNSDHRAIKAELKDRQKLWDISVPLKRGDDGEGRPSMRLLLTGDDDAIPYHRRMSTVQPRAVDWLWPGHFPRAMFSLLVGPQGCGKTYIALDMAARVSQGAAWPDGRGTAPEGNVVLFNAEDHSEYTIRPRLDAAGADADNIISNEGIYHSKSGTFESFDLVRNIRSVALLLDAYKPPLLIFDPITAFLGDTDQNSNSDVRKALNGLVRLATEFKTAIIGITHWNKGKSKDALTRVLGSTAFSALTRCLWEAGPAPKLSGSPFVFAFAKSNISAPIEGQYYKIEDDHIVWEGLTGAPKSVLAVDAHEPSKREQFKDWLRKTLAPRPLPRKTVMKWARKAGFKDRMIAEVASEMTFSVSADGGRNNQKRWKLKNRYAQKSTDDHLD